MRVLGIDYGKKKIGLSVGDTESKLAQPYSVIRFKTDVEAIKKVSRVLKVSKVSKVVVGVSEGKMGSESKNFSQDLSRSLRIPVVTFDETLTTQEANELAIQAGVKKKKRKHLEDAFSATLILQNYLDSR